MTSYLAARFPTKQPSTPTGSDGQAQDPFDFIIDCHGSQDLYVHSARYLHKGKPYISVGSANRSWTLTALFTTVLRTLVNSLWPLSPWLGGTGREWRTLLVMDPGIDVLERLAAMARGERDVIGEAEEAAERARPLRVIVDSVFGFEEVLAAYERLERGHMKGKIIIRVGQAE